MTEKTKSLEKFFKHPNTRAVLRAVADGGMPGDTSVMLNSKLEDGTKLPADETKAILQKLISAGAVNFTGTSSRAYFLTIKGHVLNLVDRRI